MSPWIWISLTSSTVMAGALASRPLGRWVKKVKRRKGGVYGYRVRHHSKPNRRHWGYIGETVSFYFRNLQHMGTSNYASEGAKRSTVAVRVPSQNWSDLDPVRYTIIALPWWLCWKWVLRPLETLVMLLTWPVYNDAKNHWNPRRIPKGVARQQRNARDRMDFAGQVRVTAGKAGRIALQVAGAVLVVVGTYGWVVTR